MSANNGGGFSFVMTKWGVLDRFIMLGTEKAGYYVGQKEQTKQSFDTVKACLKEDGLRVVARIVEYSLAGRAPKNDPAVVALALAAVYGDDATRAVAFEALPKVARTGTWLFLFVSILDSLGKWNAAAKRGVAAWYTTKQVDRLAVQLLKYQSRNGWAHRDVLRLAHVKPSSDVQSALFRYAVKGAEGIEFGTMVPQLLVDFELLKRTTDKKEVLRLIESNDFISWEMVPTQWLKDPDVLTLLVKNMGLTAVIRKLGALTAHGVIKPLSSGLKDVVAKLTDSEQLKRQRVHPITLLQSLKQYSVGHGDKGSLVWVPNQRVIDALDSAFYDAFTHVETKGENYLIACDISGSMQGANVNGSPNLTAAEVAVVMAMVVARKQDNYHIVGYNQRLVDLHVSPTMRLDAAMASYKKQHWDGAGTDCAKPFEAALANKWPVDKFVSITDNEVNSGSQHPAQALAKYRKGLNAMAKSVVIGTSVSEFTIADPKDSGSLDIAGFDSAAPQLISDL
jgi:60 kDa SS-A/Ro ribonucleoprotein